MKELRFDGRVAVVTGAGRGLGREYALLLASRGAAVVVNDVGCEADGTGASSLPAEEVVKEITERGGKAVANTDSVAEPGAAEAIVRTALDSLGGLDIVVNNAGIAETDLFRDQSLEAFRRHIDVHFWGTCLVTRAAWPRLLERSYGRVVNTVSSAIFGFSTWSAYSAAKAAIFGLSRTLALEGAEHGVKVNCLAPGGGTRMTTSVNSEHLTQETIDWAMRVMKPDLVAPVVGFLAHESCALNGELLSAGGGRVGRIFLAETEGYVNRPLSIEDVQANLERILDASRHHAFREAPEQIAFLSEAVSRPDGSAKMR